MSDSPDHYFTSKDPQDPSVDRGTVQVRIAGRDVEVETAAGVFSRGRLDLGTQVLLRKVPQIPASARNVLDLGCGWGPIALTMASQSPQSTVWAVDVNELALDLTRRNSARLGLSKIEARLPEDVPDDVRFDALWSNPPVRIGRTAMDVMLLHWLPRLAPGASAHLVVQHNLGSDSLLRWLGSRLPTEMPGVTVGKLGSAKGYRVLVVTAAS